MVPFLSSKVEQTGQTHLNRRCLKKTMLNWKKSDAIENVLYITSRSVWYRREVGCSSVHIY